MLRMPHVLETTSYLGVCWVPGNERLQPVLTSSGASDPADRKLAAQRAEQRHWHVTEPELPLVQACQRWKVHPRSCECSQCKSAATQKAWQCSKDSGPRVQYSVVQH